MNIVVSDNYAGFASQVSDEYYDFCEAFVDHRTHPELIAFVKNNPHLKGDLNIIEIPNDISDYMILEGYDNYYEAVLYVLNGKIHIKTP